ncbi:MAG: response regulator, partial [Oligoflexales bacterium]|nr:response regulator [Oligoflexales bacterium]
NSTCGATFRLIFPVLKTEALILNKGEDELLKFEKFEGLRVLLVDDEREIRSTIIESIAEFGVDQVVEAQNGIEALEILKREKFDLILTDMKMPGMGGLELVNAIKNLSLSPKPQIVVITGGVAGALEKEVRDEFRQLIDGYLLKPFDEKDIRRILRNAYSEKNISCGINNNSTSTTGKVETEHQSEVLKAGMRFNKYFSDLMLTLDNSQKPATDLIRELETAAAHLLESAGKIARN